MYLVGAGPGDPRLLTLRGAEVLQRADVVVYDRLAPAALLDLAPAGAERVDAGKARGRVALSQEEINRVLVDRGRRGLTVVRLKGGDPFVFGRGGEEALALAEAGCRSRSSPGSAPPWPPRLRRHPRHPPGPGRQLRRDQRHPGRRRPGRPGPRRGAGASSCSWRPSAWLRSAPSWSPLDAPPTAAAVIASASTGAQQVVTGTLADLAAGGVEVDPPATLVTGPTVALAGSLGWFVRRHRRRPAGRPWSTGRRAERQPGDHLASSTSPVSSKPSLP